MNRALRVILVFLARGFMVRRPGALRNSIATSLAILTLFACGGGGSNVVPPPPPRAPNVVMVMFDDLDVSVWNVALKDGYLPNIRTHVIDRGTTFDETYVSLSWCCPSRSTYLTGQFPHNHGVLRGDGPLGGFKQFHDASTIATWLHDAGYRTGLIGKYLNGYKDYSYVPPGWDTWRALVAGGTSTYCMYGYTMSMDGNSAMTFGQTEADYQTDVLTRMGDDFVRQVDARPFFLTMTPVAPHYEDCAHDGEDTGTTIRPPPRYAGTPPDPLPVLGLTSFNEADMSDKPTWMRSAPLLDPLLEQLGYDSKVAAIRAVDDMVGVIAQALKDIGAYDNTMILVTSDNGFQYGTHRREGKINMYEESIRLPMVIHGASQTTARSTSEWVMNNDWAPTIADAVQVTPGLVVDGRSLMPLVNGVPGAQGRNTLLVELPPDGVPTANNPPYYMVRTKDPVLTLDSSGADVLVYAETLDPVTAVLTDREFYDLAVDPLQVASLHNDMSPQRVQQMGGLDHRLQQMKTCAGDGCRALE